MLWIKSNSNWALWKDAQNAPADGASRLWTSNPDGSFAEIADSNADILQLSFEAVCAPLPSHAVAWWTAEGNALDQITQQLGTLESGAAFTQGIVGQAFDLSAAGSHVRIADRPELRFTHALTIETWIHPQSTGGLRDIVSKWDAVIGPDQRSFGLNLDGEGVPYFIVSATGGNSSIGAVFATNTVATPSTWTHLAATYDGASMNLYVDGRLRGQTLFDQGIYPGTGDLAIGATVGGLPAGEASSTFGGWIDEVTLYDRALADAEILGLYNAGAEGKCPPQPPVILAEPQDFEVVEGGTATFTVTATGAEPLSYQWYQTPDVLLTEATSPQLELPDVSPSADATSYFVVITNFTGSITSAPAMLRVQSLPQIESQPLDQTAEVGSSVVFSISVSGTPPISYQWYHNDELISGATAPILALSNLQPDHAGAYSVVVANPHGSVTSDSVQLLIVSGTISASNGTGTPVFTVTGLAGASYAVDWSSDLITWNPLATLFDVPETWQIPDPTGASQQTRFYRLRLLTE